MVDQEDLPKQEKMEIQVDQVVGVIMLLAVAQEEQVILLQLVHLKDNLVVMVIHLQQEVVVEAVLLKRELLTILHLLIKQQEEWAQPLQLQVQLKE